MRSYFGGYFLGQAGTFVYLTLTVQAAPQFDINYWPQMSLYNLLVANFWPLYWAAHFFDKARLNDAYWRTFDAARDSATWVYQLFS